MEKIIQTNKRLYHNSRKNIRNKVNCSGITFWENNFYRFWRKKLRNYTCKRNYSQKCLKTFCNFGIISISFHCFIKLRSPAIYKRSCYYWKRSSASKCKAVSSNNCNWNKFSQNNSVTEIYDLVCQFNKN